VLVPENEKTLKKFIYEKSEIILSKNKNLKLYKIAYYLMTFGIYFKYYKSITFSRGYLKEVRIDHYGFFSFIINFFYKYLK
jgi:hypothetical protein